MFLREFADGLEANAVAAWLAGNRDLAYEQEARGRLLMCREATTMGIEQIKQFYQGLLAEGQTQK